jgi:hypothetical protein
MTQLEGALCLVAAYFLIGISFGLDDLVYYRGRMRGRDLARMIYGWPWVLFKRIW